MNKDEGIIPQDEKSKLIMKGFSDDIARILFKKVTETREIQSREANGIYIIKFNDIKNLHLKMSQLCESLGYIKGSCNITVDYQGDSKNKFNSFEDFEKAYIDKPNETLQIIYQFNMAKKPVIDESGNLQEKMEPYKITVVLRNLRAITYKENIPVFMLKHMDFGSIHLEVEFVDYPIASTITSNLDEWVETIAHEEENRFLSFLQKIDSSFKNIWKCLFLLVPVIIFLCFFKRQIPNSLILQSAIGIFTFLTVFMEVGKWFGVRLEYYLDNIQESSRILLTTGDNNREDKEKKRRCKNIRKSILSFAFSLVINIGISILANIICAFFLK